MKPDEERHAKASFSELEAASGAFKEQRCFLILEEVLLEESLAESCWSRTEGWVGDRQAWRNSPCSQQT